MNDRPGLSELHLSWDFFKGMARCARLVDGASEVHKMVLARHYSKLGNDFWRWG
jgi:hypothetical protein